MKKRDQRMFSIAISIMIIALTFLLIGSSYAIFTLTLNGTKEQIIKSGELNVVLTDSSSEGILLENTMPVTEEVGLSQQGYSFTLENKGNIDSEYTIYIDDLALSDGKIRIEDRHVRYQIINDQGLMETKLLSQSNPHPNRFLDTGIIASGKKYKYTLKLWIDSEADNTAMNKAFKGQIRVEASQVIERLPNPS